MGGYRGSVQLNQYRTRDRMYLVIDSLMVIHFLAYVTYGSPVLSEGGLLTIS